MSRPPVSGNQCGPTRHDCTPKIHHGGSGAMRVRPRPRRESRMVGQAGGSMASRASPEGEPLGRHEVAEGTGLIAAWASPASPVPYGQGVVSHGGVASRQSTHQDTRPPPRQSLPGPVGVEVHRRDAWGAGGDPALAHSRVRGGCEAAAHGHRGATGWGAQPGVVDCRPAWHGARPGACVYTPRPASWHRRLGKRGG